MKKSVPFPKLSLQRRRRFMALGSTRDRMLRKQKKRDKESDDQGSTTTQDMREARIRKARKLVKNACIAKVLLTIFRANSKINNFIKKRSKTSIALQTEIFKIS